MSDGAKLNGQTFDPRFGAIFPFTERVHDYDGPETARVTGLEGQASTDISPIDRGAAKVRVTELSIAQAVLDAKVVNFIGIADLSADLPPVLKTLTSSYNFSLGSGVNNHPASQQFYFSSGTSASVSFNPRARAQASAALQPDLTHNIEDTFAQRVPTIGRYFFMPETMTDVTFFARLSAIMAAPVLAWPKFKPVALSFSLKGQQVSIMEEADTTQSVSISETEYDNTYQYGGGYSTEVGLSTQTKSFPPTLHAAITIANASRQETIFANVAASTRAVTGIHNGAPLTIPGVTNDPIPIIATVEASITPVTIPATVPPAIPTSGLYLWSVNYGESLYNRVPFRVEMVDFSYFA